MASIVFGSLLCHLITLEAIGPNIAARLASINLEKQLFYGRNPGLPPLPRIGQTHIRKDGWGALHGPAFKAAITRNSAGFFVHIARKWLISGSPEEAAMLRAVQALYDIYICNLMERRTLFTPSAGG